jgi:hypothetical protein
MARRRDPYQEDYERAKAADFPKPGPQPVPGQWAPGQGVPGPGVPGPGVPGRPPGAGPAPAPRTSTNPVPFLLALGGVSVGAAIVLQFVKVTAGGISLTASQANGICQSALGQLGQAFSGGFGDTAPSSVCGRAAMIEDWKGVATWLGIVLIGAGLLVFVRRSASSRPGGFQASGPQFGGAPQPGGTPQFGATPPAGRHAARPRDWPAAERAEAEAGRLRAQAAQPRAEQARTQNPPQPGFPYGS